MKKILTLLTLTLILLCLAAGVLADEATEITEQCSFKLGDNKNPKNLTDKKFTTNAESKKAVNPELTVTCKTEPIHGLYLCFEIKPDHYTVEADRGNGWETVTEGNEFYHAYYEIGGATSVRVRAEGSEKQIMGLNEVYVFGEGEPQSWVQRWDRTPEKCDVLFAVAHPEEEILYLGGAIPTYAREKNSTVAVACLTIGNTTRRSELLNGLWAMGCHTYPIMGEYKIANASSVAKAYKNIDAKRGEDIILGWVTETIRATKPQVIVTLGTDGEGGNGQRMMLADAFLQCFDLAATGDARFNDSESRYGLWQARKLYLHQYGKKDDRIEFDWLTPLESMGGRNGINLAYCAYQLHKTQIDQKNATKSVIGTGSKYENHVFGLAKTTVGPDTEHQCFLENIPEEDLTPETIQEAKEDWTATVLPAVNEKGFLDEGEFVYGDDKQGHYAYISSTLKVIINRKYDGSYPLTWFESEIWCDTEAGECMQNFEYTPEKAIGKKSAVKADINALKNKVVFAVNGDYYTYRVGSKSGQPVGIEIRDGQVYFDEAYKPGNKDETSFFPNKATMAFYKDGKADVHHCSEMNAKAYLDKDAYMVLSFGPYLIRDGKLSDWVWNNTYKSYFTKNPRHSFGMVEEGHYVDIMCEGRLGTRSEGVSMTQLAMLAEAAGCTEALNLDGGQTAIVVFMGKQLNKIVRDEFRATTEVLGVGVSDLVGTVDFSGGK